jgi:hypothetical protein
MKIHVLSDVHLEFGKWPREWDVNNIDADISVLAGDIGVGLEGIEWALTFDRPVVYVMGNHEFYNQRPMMELWKEARQKVMGTHVHLLENDALAIADPRNADEQVRFLGATLWTDFCLLGPECQEECMESAKRKMSDFNSIYVTRNGSRTFEPRIDAMPKGDRLTPRKALAMHHLSRDFLEHELNRSPDDVGLLNFWTKTIVVTHHAPSDMSLLSGEARTAISSAYASKLDGLIPLAELWIHGHTHYKVDYRVGSGRVVSNPRGYMPDEKVSNFDYKCVIDI